MNFHRFFSAVLLFTPLFFLNAQEGGFVQERLQLSRVLGRTTGISQGTANAAGKVPRHLFVPQNRIAEAYTDRSFPLGGGRFLPSPTEAALFISPLNIGKNDRVLIAGTTTGYTAALISQLAGEVLVMEENNSERDLLRGLVNSEVLPEAVSFANIRVLTAWNPVALPEEQTFSVIVLHGSSPVIPAALLNRLETPGRLAAVLSGESGFSLSFYLTRDLQGEQIKTGKEVFFPKVQQW